MSAPQQQRKLLRIGIIQGGRIVEERVIKSGESVTIGDSNQNTFVLPSLGLPSRFSMFIAKGSQYHLAFTDDMDGKLSMDGGVVEGFDGIKSKSTREKDGTYHFPLTEQIRGKITIAGTTILFQFVVPPAVAASGAGAEFSASMFKSVDTTYWGIFAGSAALHAAVILYAMQLPPPPEPTLDTIDDRFAEIIVPDKPKKEEEKKEEVKEGDKKEEDKKADEKKKGDEKKEQKKETPKPEISDAERKAAKQDALKKTGILAVLGARGGTGNPLGAILRGNSTGSENLGSAISQSGTMAMAPGGGGLRGELGGGALIGVDGDVGGTGADATVKTEKKVAKAPPKVTTEEAQVQGGDAGSVNSALSKYKSGILNCYENVLKNNPEARGKLTLSFVIEPGGRLSNIETRVQGFSDEAFEGCVKTRAKGWKFKIETEDPVDVSTSFVLSK